VIQYGREVFAYHVQTDANDREAACFLEPSWVMEHGLNLHTASIIAKVALLRRDFRKLLANNSSRRSQLRDTRRC
jgi:hypothetical protein